MNDNSIYASLTPDQFIWTLKKEKINMQIWLSWFYDAIYSKLCGKHQDEITEIYYSLLNNLSNSYDRCASYEHKRLQEKNDGNRRKTRASGVKMTMTEAQEDDVVRILHSVKSTMAYIASKGNLRHENIYNWTKDIERALKIINRPLKPMKTASRQLLEGKYE